MATALSAKTEFHLSIADLSKGYQGFRAVKNQINKVLEYLFKFGYFTEENGLKVNVLVAMNIKDALYKNFKSLRDLRAALPTKEDCIKFLEDLIWEGEPVSPYDPSEKVYKCRDGWYKGKKTKKEFNILTGTLFQCTRIDLTIWFEVIFRLHSCKTGLTSTTIAREYGISQRAAWFMLQKIKNAMGMTENFKKLGGPGKTVETDEYYEGGSYKNMHYDKKLKAKEQLYGNKKPEQGFVERGGDAVMVAIPDTTESTLVAGTLRYVAPGSNLFTDDNPSYNKIPPLYNRESVVHSKGNYVTMKGSYLVYTNTQECVWALNELMKKIHIHISSKHLQSYANEVIFRYNTRKMKSADACIWLLQNIQGTRFTREEIRNAKYRLYNRNQERAA